MANQQPRQSRTDNEPRWQDDYDDFDELWARLRPRIKGMFESHVQMAPTAENGQRVIITAGFELDDATKWWGTGDAKQDEVKPRMREHFVRLAETRALGRAADFAIGRRKSARVEEHTSDERDTAARQTQPSPPTPEPAQPTPEPTEPPKPAAEHPVTPERVAANEELTRFRSDHPELAQKLREHILAQCGTLSQLTQVQLDAAVRYSRSLIGSPGQAALLPDTSDTAESATTRQRQEIHRLAGALKTPDLAKERPAMTRTEAEVEIARLRSLAK